MEPLHQELIRQLDFQLGESMRKIEVVWSGLSDAQIWVRPNESCLAPANQLIHLTGNLRQWVGTALAGLPEVRTREAEFAAHGGASKEAIYEAFVEQWAFAKTRLAEATDLLAPHTIQGHATTELGVWIHMVEHLSYHTGQLIYAAKALDGRAFDFYGGWDLGE